MLLLASLKPCNIRDFAVDPSIEPSEEILCIEDDVLHFLLTLDTSKVSGHDGISVKMLKSTAQSIYPFLTHASF